MRARREGFMSGRTYALSLASLGAAGVSSVVRPPHATSSKQAPCRMIERGIEIMVGSS